jgi:DoxX-like family
MEVATAIVSALLALLLVVTAGQKLTHSGAVVASYARVGVPEERLNTLAALLLAGAAGLLLGLSWPPLGIAAAAGLACYFVAAVVAHIRFRDLRRLPTPIAFEALALAALVLQLD